MEALRELIEAWLLVNASSQAELAQRSGVKQNVISRWLNGQVDDASAKNLKLIAPVLGMTYGDLLRRMGEITTSDSRTEIDARRQAVRDQLDRWLTAVGPENEEFFWQHLKAQGDLTVDLVKRIGTAINADAEEAVNAAVSGRAQRGRPRRKSSGGPLTATQHGLREPLEPGRTAPNRHHAA